MPTTIELSSLPAGIALSHALAGEQVTIATTEFFSSEDGNDCIVRLESISDCFEPFFLAAKLKPSQVDHFVAIVSKDRTATIYCNELKLMALTRAKRAIKGGEEVRKDDIADIVRLEFRKSDDTLLEIPQDCGIAVILSVGWRKGVFYDYEVLRPDGSLRSTDLHQLLGHIFARLMFEEMFSITEEQWTTLIDWGWFPFIALSSADRQTLISWTGASSSAKTVLEDICNAFKQKIEVRLESWKASAAFSVHLPFVMSAKDRYLNSDYLGCISILYPRIEGIMRELHLTDTSTSSSSQNAMLKHLASKQSATSLLLPSRFKEYLLQFYFRSFDTNKKIPLSRHSLAHGLARAEDCDLNRATLGFLILDQLFYYLK